MIDKLNKLDKFKKTLDTTKIKEKDLNSKVNSLTEINKNVTESYNVSLKIIVDVTKLLNQYMLYFNEIDKVINSLNDSNNTTLSLANNYFDNINKLTSEKIDELTNNFKNQIETVKTIYSKNNLPTEDLEKYNSLLATINSDSKLLLKKQGGNKKYRKYNK
tara:strand:- start:374 stop:856 length:483 start_codon:yes stop_codon:yes gene_type:complete